MQTLEDIKEDVWDVFWDADICGPELLYHGHFCTFVIGHWWKYVLIYICKCFLLLLMV